MEKELTSGEFGSQTVVYAGRFADRVADQVAEAGVQDDSLVLSEWEVMPPRLTDVTEQAATLVILDLFSFPFEAMTGKQWDVPLILVLPLGFDAGFLETVFGAPVFERLGFFDRVVTQEPGVWKELSRRYRWAAGQRIELEGGLPEEMAVEVLSQLEEEYNAPAVSGDERYEAYTYWNERGEVLARTAPHRAVCSVRHGPDFNKAMHRVQATALESQFAAARGIRADDVPFDVLEVGAGVGRWAASFDPSRTRFSGLDVSGAMVEAARDNFPEADFDLLGPDLEFPYEDESFDLAFTVTVLHHNLTPAKKTLLSEMWRVTKPGGRLMFLEDFVAPKRTDESTVYPVSVSEFVRLVIEATGGQVVLEYVESLRYPSDDFFRGGLISLSKLGIPKRW
ncbi:hypothetical protein BH24ACT22_BH24ACT22_15020 [soil metagenome]